MTFPHQPGLAGSPWPPTPHQSQKAGCLDTVMESSFPAQQLGPDVEQMYIPREARPPALAGTPKAAHRQHGHLKEVSVGAGPLEAPAQDPPNCHRVLARRENFFFSSALIDSREKDSMAPDRPTPASLQGAENKTLFSSRSWNLLPGQAIGWFFPSFLGTRRCVDQSCLGPLRESPE